MTFVVTIRITMWIPESVPDHDPGPEIKNRKASVVVDRSQIDASST